MLEEARKFLVDSGASKVPIYLLATQGMRNLDTSDNAVSKDVLRHAHKVMKEERRDGDYRGIFKLGNHPDELGKPDRSARIITGRTEGVLAWVAVNHGFQKKESTDSPLSTIAIFEVGGASMQIAFDMTEAGDSDDHVKVCLPSGDHYIHAAFRKDYGVDSMLRRLLPIVETEEVANVENECLRTGDKIRRVTTTYSGTVYSANKWEKYVFSYNFFD
jgi:hypothetical protein